MSRDTGRGIGLLIARVCLAVIFVHSGLHAVQSTASTAVRLTAAGYPVPEAMAWVAALAQLAGAVSLLLGMLTPLGCVALILFLLPTTYSFHLPGLLHGDRGQTIQTFKNLAMVGGLIALLFAGPGPFSIDRRILRGGRQ